MPVTPAYCKRCDAVFGPKWAIPLEGLDKNLNVPEEGFPCPHCGARAEVLHGIYETIGDAIRLLCAAERDVEELERLAAILTRARRARQSRDELVHAIEEQLPQLSEPLRGLLTGSSQELGAVTAILLQILFEVLTQEQARPFPIDVNITPYVTVLIEKLVRSKPWKVPLPRDL